MTTKKTTPARRPKKQGAAKPTRAPRARAARQAPTFAIPPEVAEHFGDERIAVVESMYPAASTADVIRLLDASYRLGLDPVAHDLYLARGRARDGGEPEYTVAIRRDAALKFAERQPRYRGMDSDAIYAKDDFARTEPDGSGLTMRARAGIKHTYGLPTQRGELIGAWAAVEVANPDGSLRPPTFFVALLADYQPDPASLDDEDPWKAMPAACVEKASQLWCLRIGLGMEGVIGAEEMHRAEAAADSAPTVSPSLIPGAELDETDQRIVALFERATVACPGEFTAALVKAKTKGQPEDARAAFADEMEAAILTAEGAATAAA